MQDYTQPGDMIMQDRIVVDPAIQHGKPVIRGTRVPVARTSDEQEARRCLSALKERLKEELQQEEILIVERDVETL